MQFQFTDLGIDCEANALDQGTPALQLNLWTLQLVGNGAAERNQANHRQSILNALVFERCIDCWTDGGLQKIATIGHAGLLGLVKKLKIDLKKK